jgi:hypothetical protein
MPKTNRCLSTRDKSRARVFEKDGSALRKIAAGEHDTYVRRWARAAAHWDRSFFLRLAPEMNGDWQPGLPG